MRANNALMRNLIAFDASSLKYTIIIADVAPPTWRISRYGRDGEAYALDDLKTLKLPVVVAALALDCLTRDLFVGKILIETAQSRSIPVAVIGNEDMKGKFAPYNPIHFIPRLSGQISNNLEAWFDAL
jgi:hypothetical protein